MNSRVSLIKAFSLLAMLPRRPAEFSERLTGLADYVSEGMRARRPFYEPESWARVVAELEQLQPGIAAHLEEPSLRALESRVAQRYQEVAHGAWSERYSADLALARCLFSLCRATRPTVVVETGVAYGMTSAFILEALERNEHGTLFSIDLPPLGGREQKLVGALVRDDVRSRWVLRRGSSRRELPGLVRERIVDIFVHDSLHTYRNMCREFAAAWPRLRPGGWIVSDDIEGNPAFLGLRQRAVRYWQVVRQETKASLIGLAVKDDSHQ
jgi:predicted O-methyltransferase YrrM